MRIVLGAWLAQAVACEGLLGSQCALRPGLPACTDLIDVQPVRLSRGQAEELVRVEFAQESVARELDQGTKALVEVTQKGGPSLELADWWHQGRIVWVRIPRAELLRLRGGLARLTVRIGERQVQAELSVHTPPVYSGPPTIRETLGFVPTQVRFHPKWQQDESVLQPMVVQGLFTNEELPDGLRGRACWLPASLDLPTLSKEPTGDERMRLSTQCPRLNVAGCQLAFDGNGCLLELCIREEGRTLVRYLTRFNTFASGSMPESASQCSSSVVTSSFGLNTQLQTDPQTGLVGVLWRQPTMGLTPPDTIRLLSTNQLDQLLAHSIEGQGFAILHAALGDFDPPLGTSSEERSGDLLALSWDGRVKILLQKPSSFRELSDPAWQLTEELQAKGPRTFDHYNGVALADVDGDGWQDILILGYTADRKPRLVYAANLKGQALAPLVELRVDGSIDDRFVHAGLSAGDVDGDGDIDLVLFSTPDSPSNPTDTQHFLAFLRNEAR